MSTLSARWGAEVSGAALQVSVHQFAESLGRAMAVKALWASAHSEEVARVSEILATAMDLPAGVVRMIHLAGHLHDIGKIGIPDCILNKPGRLNQEEFRIIQEHAAMGEAIVRPVMVLDGEVSVPDIVRHHHERYDGSGYPDGLRGGDIPLGARIVAVADSLSAMMQDRPYKSPMGFAEAAGELMALAGVWYDPRVMAAFVRVDSAIQDAMIAARMATPPSCGRWALCETGSCLRGGDSMRDPLTGVFSRRYFGQFLASVLAGPQDCGLCLALVDCDRFRDFNREYGQEQGDQTLEQLGRVIQASVRDGVDYPFRFGRDVFGVAFRGLDLRACRRACERIRVRFQRECRPGCTVSVGLAAWEQRMGCDDGALIQAAQTELSRAKDAGRNRVCTARTMYAWSGTPLLWARD